MRSMIRLSRPSINRMINLFLSAHAGRNDDGPSSCRWWRNRLSSVMDAEGNLVAGRVEPFHKVDRTLIPTGNEPENVLFATVGIYLFVFQLPELETAFEVAIGRPKGVFARLSQLLGGVDYVDCALLKLDRIAPAKAAASDQLLGDLQ